MPVVLEGIDLVVVAALFVVVGLLYTVKWWLRPAFLILESTIGRIPGIVGFVISAENAVIGALDMAISAVQNAAIDLFKGGVSLAKLTGNAIFTLATQVEQVLTSLWHTQLPALFHVWIDPIHAEINAVIGSLGAINDRLTGAVNSLDSQVDHVAHQIGATIEPALHELTSATIPHLQSRLTDVEHTLTGEIAELARATGKTVASIEHDLSTGLADAAKSAINARSVIEGEIAAGLSAAEAFARSSAGAIERELIDYENLVPLAKIGTIIAAWPFVYSLTQSLVTEAGLGNAECRRKVGDVCGVPSQNWANLLGGLAVVGLDLGLSDILGAVESIFETVIDDAISIAES